MNINSPKTFDFTFIDLFAGIGGFHIALNSLRGECVYASEWNKEARETYIQNFINSPSNTNIESFKFEGDITLINPKDIPNHDVLCAGFPCQPFSISGKQNGFNDTRGTLFFNILEILRVKKPKIVFLENVKHLIHHDKGRTFKVIIQELSNLGYKVSWKILNSKDFGLPQNRERTIIVGSKERLFDFNKIKYSKQVSIKDILDNKGNFEYLEEGEFTILPKNLWKTQKSGLIFCGYRNKSIRSKGTRPNTIHLSRVHKQPNRIYHVEGTHPTIPSQETTGRFWIYDEKNVRKLTLNECYRLQGFPSNFIINKKSSEGYKQIGNSVAIPMIEAIIEQIKEQLL
jgi:DNA (cytosine-5)-methyltransferase 1